MESLKDKLTEEEATSLINTIIDYWDFDELSVKQIVKRLKAKGYIKQNPVEKAEDIISHRDHEYYNYSKEYLIDSMKDAIDYLKEQLEEK